MPYQVIRKRMLYDAHKDPPVKNIPELQADDLTKSKTLSLAKTKALFIDKNFEYWKDPIVGFLYTKK